MNATSSKNRSARAFNLPYQLGVYLAANAVSDAGVVVDGSDCALQKVGYLAGNHDLYSTLFSQEGGHRVLCTMSEASMKRDNPEKELSAILWSAAGSGNFSVVLLTGLPFLKLAGLDYAGLAAGIKARAPVVDVPAGALEADWLEGYALSLDALARALPAGKVKKRKRSVALVGYLMDRNERDHAANLSELRGLLELCGLELACVFPSGGNFAELGHALEADVIVSLPYGRKAASRLAARTGAALVETGLPMGFKGTAQWLQEVRRAAGLKGGLPQAVKDLERQAAVAVSPALEVLAHRNVVYAGDPYLFSAFSSFASELRLRVKGAFLDSFARPLGGALPPAELHFSPGREEALAALGRLTGYSKPELVVGNSFAVDEGLTAGLPFTELGFPSYGHHCLGDEPFLGFAGARTLAGRLLNSLHSGKN